MNDKSTLERLASLETKVEILLDLLKEIRDDLKNNPDKEEFLTLQERVKTLELIQHNLTIKVASTSALVSLFASLIIGFITNYFFKH